MRGREYLGMVLAGLGWVFVAASARAGVPECNGVRLEDVGRCEIRGDVSCSAGCGDVGVYKKACATKLHTVCRETCTLSAMPTCTDDCTETCTQRCDAGEDITCIHNCFGECVGACEVQCEGAADLDQCMASCEATCDGECDVKCAPLVSGSCYEHCIECCDGSCGAQANMDCQTSCQEEQFEDCEYELRLDCDASCQGDGALFCDGEFVLAGTDIPDCVKALSARGIRAQAEVALDLGQEALDQLDGELDDLDDLGDRASSSASGSCHVASPGASTRLAWLALFGAVLGWRLRRRQR